MKKIALVILSLLLTVSVAGAIEHDPNHYRHHDHDKPIDSELKVKVGDMAPDFALESVDGHVVKLSDYRGKKNVILSFVPAAWTPVCSDQWPGYNVVLDLFAKHDAILLGISEDNSPSQATWIRAMGGLGFLVLSDFWPHGEAASAYGVLRSSGEAERALFIVDKKGIIRWIHVSNIDKRPDLGDLVKALEEVGK